MPVLRPVSLRVLSALVFPLLLFGCNDFGDPKDTDDGGSGPRAADTGQEGVQATVRITDAPADEVTQVRVTFTALTLGREGGEAIEVRLPRPRVIADLTALQGGNATVLATINGLPPGNYDWLELHMIGGGGASWVSSDLGGQHELFVAGTEPVPETEQRLRISRPFTVSEAGLDVTLDVDLRRGLTRAGEIFFLSPAVRLVNTAESGAIQGTVDPRLVQQEHCTNDPAADEGNAVYLHAGGGTDDTRDIWLDVNGAAAGGGNPEAVVPVRQNARSGEYEFIASFLPAGSWTLVFTCQSRDDNPATREELVFSEPINAEVVVGQPTSEVHIPFPNAPGTDTGGETPTTPTIPTDPVDPGGDGGTDTGGDGTGDGGTGDGGTGDGGTGDDGTGDDGTGDDGTGDDGTGDDGTGDDGTGDDGTGDDGTGDDGTGDDGTGDGGTGDGGTGDDGTGDDGTGDDGTGDDGTGDDGTGEDGTGDDGTGDDGTGDDGTGDDGTGDGGTGDSGSGDGDTTSGDSTSGDTTSGDTTSGDTTSGDTTSGDTTSGDTTSGDTTSGDTTSGDTTSGDTTSGDTTSGDTTSGDTTSSDTTSSDTTSGDTTSSDTTSGDTTSGDTTSGDTTSGDSTSGDTTSGDTTSGDTTSGDTTSGDTTSGDTTSGDTTSGDTTSGDTTSGDDTPA